MRMGAVSLSVRGGDRPRRKAVAIVQSNYIPWKGYFDLIRSVEEFILFDDMQSFIWSTARGRRPFRRSRLRIYCERGPSKAISGKA
jgi:hypothetical protein